jgi:glycerol-3-phosphate O-acyltransferase / dihydroxyacetone phosphate acyltransferase
MTAKDTQFGKGTFSSWLIENVGTLPIKRKKDHAEGDADNSQVMAKIIDVRHALTSLPCSIS